MIQLLSPPICPSGCCPTPEPWWPLFQASPATLPSPPAALTHFRHLHHGVGLWLNWKKEKKKKKTAIRNLNETKFISLCCHFIFHRSDGEGTGEPRGPFCSAHRMERQEEGGTWLRDRKRPRPLPAHTRTKMGQGWPLPWRSATRVRGRRLKEHLSLQRGSDQTRAGREEPSSTPSSRVFSNTNRAGLGAS